MSRALWTYPEYTAGLHPQQTWEQSASDGESQSQRFRAFIQSVGSNVDGHFHGRSAGVGRGGGAAEGCAEVEGAAGAAGVIVGFHGAADSPIHHLRVGAVIKIFAVESNDESDAVSFVNLG